LRQAARILEHEDLLTVRRGKKGGLFARLPTSDTLAHVASVVLRAHGATLEDLTRVNAIVGAEAARLAAARAPERDRRSLHELAVEQLGDESPDDLLGEPGGESAGQPRCESGGEAGGELGGDVAVGRAVLDTVLEVNRRLATLSGSPTLAMFGSALAELAHANAEVRIYTDPERLASTRHYIRALTAAVANSDADVAAELVGLHHDCLLRWMRRSRPLQPGGELGMGGR
jgi:DNA-binding FadR family transcriptional regulator